MALCSCLALCSIACSRPAGSKLARSAKTRSILPKAAVSPFVMHATRNQRFAIALLSSVDERAEHGLDHGFDGRIIDALGLRQFGRDGFEVAIAADGDSGTAAWRTIAS